jgi:hypothetical protein
MTKKEKNELDFQKIRLEIKPGLFIDGDNSEEFKKMYNLALERKKDSFPFRNEAGELFKIETDYITFLLTNLTEEQIKNLEKDSDKFNKRQEKELQEEIEMAIKEHEEDEKGLTDEDMPEEELRVRQWRRTLYDKHIKNK